MLSPGSRRQAEMPVGATVLPNPHGTAPGFLVRDGARLIAAMPGVPSEMRAMARALLDAHVPPGGAFGSRRVLACGLTESAAGVALRDLMDHDRPARDALRVGIAISIANEVNRPMSATSQCAVLGSRACMAVNVVTTPITPASSNQARNRGASGSCS